MGPKPVQRIAATSRDAWESTADLSALISRTPSSVVECETAPLTEATVMLVDDEPTTLEVVQTLLEEAGYQRFITTCDSMQAMDLLCKRRPDVVLLDLMMPGTSGFDVLAQMQAHSELRYTPAIILTSASDSATKLKALELGATDFLAKPVDPSELTLRLRNTLAFKAYQDRLANFDPVTGLQNRRMFLVRLEWALRRVRRHPGKLALLHLGLNRFKRINDTLGHGSGDALLCAVAERLDESIRDCDAIARVMNDKYQSSLSKIGGDEFSVLLTDIPRVETATVVARRMLTAMSRPFSVKGHDLFVTAGVGIAIYPYDGIEPESLLKHAAAAMQEGKRHGDNSIESFSKEINAKACERLTIENQLRKALERNELVLHYQPKVDIATGRIVGAEALVRCQHPVLGLIPPTRFIPVAEETGLIAPLGKWVLEQACKQCQAWQQAGLGPVRVAVNVSGAQLRKGDLLPALHHALRTSGLAAQHLVLELTESILTENAAESITTLRAMKDIGLRLSIDDFGTGYSSLSYLKRFPLDELKIDRSFIHDVPADADNVAIVCAVIALAHNLGLKVVAEGVETEQQLDFLKEKSCDEYQGFFFGKPMPGEAFTAVLQRRAESDKARRGVLR